MKWNSRYPIFNFSANALEYTVLRKDFHEKLHFFFFFFLRKYTENIFSLHQFKLHSKLLLVVLLFMHSLHYQRLAIPLHYF